MIRTSLLSATTLASLLFALAPAHALSSRAWVSGKGTDAAGCGSPASPCRSFQYVHDHIIAAGGEIDVLDPAGYGVVTISKALSIVNDGVGTAGVQQAATAANAIAINAGASDVVTLRGLNIDGLGTGANGIVFNSGGGLTVVNCVVRHFADNGVLIQPTSGSMSFLISNVVASDNADSGVYFRPPSGSPIVTGAIDHVTSVYNSAYGIAINATSAGGGAVKIAVSDSIASNDDYGIWVGNGSVALTVSIDNSNINTNQTGLLVEGPATVLLGRSVITSNSNEGVYNVTSPNTLYTYGDNRINGNGFDIPAPLNTILTPQ